MITKLLLTVALAIVPLGGFAQKGTGRDTLHTPRHGSAEEQGILQGLRHQNSPYYKEAASFKVHYLKVHKGWAWADVTPLDSHRKATAEGGPNLLHLKTGHWKTLDLSKVPADPNDPIGLEDSSTGFVKNLRKQFPGVPADIFPKPKH